MSLIIVSDLHLKNKEPFLSASRKFLNWLNENYSSYKLLFLGDCFDSSAPIWEVYSIFKEFLLSRSNHTYLLQGNHDLSKSKGCALSSFGLLDEISVYEDKAEVFTTDNLNCLILPFKYDYKDYSHIEGNFDFIFSHIVPTKVQFANEGIDFPNIKGIFIHGHTHIFKEKEYIDTYMNKHIILGVPLSTRNGEDQKHQIIEIDDNKNITYIDVPYYFKYETINYGEEPTNKNNILNIINAPNRKLVFEKYKDYYIREEGIELLRTETTKEDYKKEFESANILQKFKKYAEDKGLSKEVLECCSTKLSQIV